MIFYQYELKGKAKKELDTEIRFLCASARAESVELICFYIPDSLTEKSENKGRISYIKSILRAMKKENLIQFCITKDRLEGRTVEADFLRNKYGEYITPENDYCFIIYAKL